MEPLDRTIDVYTSALDTLALTLENLGPAITDAGDLIAGALLRDGKVLACGEGSSGLMGQLFTTCLLNRFERDRPGLPALCLNSDAATLNAIASDNTPTEVFSRPIRALGQDTDVLLVLCGSEASGSVLQAVQAAHDRHMPVIALCGEGCDDIAALLGSEDLRMHIPSANRARVVEVQLLIIHCLCDLIDQSLFGSED